jgi:F0F1-type ATP synthase assembly protein I
MSLVTIANVQFSYEAELIRSRLEATGIRCFLSGERVASTVGPINALNTSWSNPTGGIGVQVADIDARRARELLKENDESDGDESQRRSPRALVTAWGLRERIVAGAVAGWVFGNFISSITLKPVGIVVGAALCAGFVVPGLLKLKKK